MLKALSGIVAAVFTLGRRPQVEAATEEPPQAVSPTNAAALSSEKSTEIERLKKLLEEFSRECACRGDQYGSWGPCERCKQLGHRRPYFADGMEHRPYRNYLITETEPDKFVCEVMIQDGWERWDEASLDAAVESVVCAAKVLNGTKVGEGNISIRRLSLNATE